jgi:flagellar hook-associated protein 1 FlgK
VITPDMTLASGALSGLTLNGTPITPGDAGIMGGGGLGARFAQRDEITPAAQAQLDAVARDLIGRFADPAVDPTLAPGDTGLFTDAGAAFDPLNEVGLSGRMSLNPLADPAQGGQVWRLRDGLGAAAPGDVGASTLLRGMAAVLTDPRTPSSGAFSGAARGMGGLAADLLSGIATTRQDNDVRVAYTGARRDALTALQLQDGVDADGELQILLQVEQSYAANARVIQAMDDLIRQLIGL